VGERPSSGIRSARISELHVDLRDSVVARVVVDDGAHGAVDERSAVDGDGRDAAEVRVLDVV
jgi:hypothetical protein